MFRKRLNFSGIGSVLKFLEKNDMKTAIIIDSFLAGKMSISINPLFLNLKQRCILFFC